MENMLINVCQQTFIPRRIQRQNHKKNLDLVKSWV